MKIRGPQLRLGRKGLRLTKPSARIGGTSGINISSRGINASVRTKAGTYNSRDGCSLRLFGILLVVFAMFSVTVILVACAPSEDSISTAIAQTEAANPTTTLIPSPTKTPRPTSTPRPTNTPRPTVTRTPKPEPIVLSGNGDSVVDLQKWDSLALAHITYTGGGNFAVWNYGPNNEKIDLMVNTIGSYEGIRPLDFLDYEQTTRFEIKASGPWEIEILPFEDVRVARVPGLAEGIGDDVIALIAEGTEQADILTIDGSNASSNFAIWGYGNARELLVNEIAPYSGTVLVSKDLPTDNGVLILVIVAEGNWSVDVNTK